MRLGQGFLVAAMVAVAVALTVASPAMARDAYVTGVNPSVDGPGEQYVVPVELPGERALAEIPLATSGEGSPDDIAITPDGRTAYVVAGSSLVPVDVATNVAGKPIPLGREPYAIAIAPDGLRAYVAERAGSVVYEVDLATSSVSQTIAVGENPDAVAVSPDGTRVYVANPGLNTLSVIDVATATVIGSIPVGEFPDGIAITPDGSRLYVSNADSGDVEAIGPTTNAVVATIPTAPFGGEVTIAPDGANAFATGSILGWDDVYSIDLATAAVKSTIPTTAFVEDLAITPDGSRLYATTEGDEPEGLMPIDIADDSAGAVVPVGERPGAIAIVPNQPPRAAFASSPAAPASGSAVSFDAAGSVDPDGSVARYEWEFGDGTTATAAGPAATHTYAKPGTYQVTLTETDNEGCSTRLVFTGQTAYCNGSGVARVTHPVTVVAPTSPAAPSNPQSGGGQTKHPHHPHHHHAHHNSCVVLSVGASSFVPKRRPGHVVPGVRVRVAPSVPGKVTIKVALLRRHHEVSLGKKAAEVRHWRRMRFVLPPSLRGRLPYGTPAKVKVTTTLRPRKKDTCVLRKEQKPTVLDLHVVRVFPRAVQSYRGAARQAIWNLPSHG